MLRKIASATIDLYVLAVAAWAAAWRLGRDRWGLLGLANAWAFWIIVTAMPTGALRLARRSRWMSCAWLAAGLALLARRYTYAWPRAKARAPGDAEPGAEGAGLRFLSFNLLKENGDAEAAAAMIRRESPDVVVLQELVPEMDAALAASLAAEYPYCHYERAHFPGRRLGIYARLPFQITGAMASSARTFALRATFDLAGASLDVYDIHLLPTAGKKLRIMGPTPNFRLRARQAQRLVDEIRLRGRPALALGDYNMTEASEVYRILRGGLEDAWRAAGSGFGWTWPRSLAPRWRVTTPPIFRIDYCFCTPDARPWRMRVVRDRLGSDHCPLVVDLRLGPASSARSGP